MARVRINKYLAEAGLCSRRKADDLVASGKVLINGTPAKLGDTVSLEDRIEYQGRLIRPVNKKIYLAYHKPYGVITTMDKNADNSIARNVKTNSRVFPIGRLDVQSTGLILLTNDGDLAQKILHAKFGHEKEYVVGVHKDINIEFLKRLEHGIILDGTKTAPAKAAELGPRRFSITITEGRNRQVRRMCEKLGYEVLSLKRVRVSKIELGDLPVGASRELTDAEVESLKS